MKTTIQVEVFPFDVPMTVRARSATDKAHGVNPIAFPTSDLDAYTLDALCNELRARIFEKAGLQQPPQVAEMKSSYCAKCAAAVTE